MQVPAQPSDPRATVVPVNDVVNAYPRIPGYRMLRRLGQGGMATVYLATQESLDRPVSIKVMEPDALLDESSKQRFENEARTIAKLAHPGIVNIYEVGRTGDGRLYYSMAYLANGDLSQRDLRSEAHIVEVLRALLSALDYAHARGIVHRDVKQENVLFDADNRPLLTDFGIALSKEDTVRVTTAGLAVGSSGYMAPEQARGAVVDRRADLYSVGVLAYELLTGALPFQSPDALAMALMHAQDAIPRLPPARSHWQGFINRAMAKSPGQRYDNAQQMLDELDRIGRRSGTQLSGRVLRTYDRTLAGNGWKRPRILAIAATLLLAVGLYAERDRLPHRGATEAPKPQVVATSRPAIPAPSPASTASKGPVASTPTAATTPAHDQSTTATVSPAAIPSSAPGDRTSSPPTSQPRTTHKKNKHAKTVRQRPAKPGLIKRFWQRIRHPSR